MKRISLAVVAAGVFTISGAMSCKHSTSTQGNPTSARIMCYNVENLFDTQNDPNKNDDDFTPSGKLAWDEAKYQTKLLHIAEVIKAVDANLPAVVGLCEVENAAVLKDLVKQPLIKEAKYGIVHYESPDERGIDVAMLYKKDSFKLISSKAIVTELPNPQDKFTRDILYVKGNLEGGEVHLFVNHWPSRSGGQEQTEPLRMFVASVLKHHLDSIRGVDANAKIICMGDFNDFPDDKSMANVLNAGPSEKELASNELPSSSYAYYNYMWQLQRKKEGTHYYKGEWSPLDQFVCSKALVEGNSGWVSAPGSAHIFRGDLVMFSDKEGNKRPNRTYVGNDYKGGYSDHLPVYLDLQKK
jgi:predicted extracellular nuclease